MSAEPRSRARTVAAQVWALFAVGLALSGLMVARQQVGGDQLNLLARGWLLADQGRFISYGNPMSSGGKAPGGATTLLVALPLHLWQDFRAPALVILACHALAFLILNRSLRRILTPRERVFFAILYWLSPWRLYHSGFLWNPNYLFLFGAAHLATALAQRERPRFWASAAHAAALVLAFQVHASFLLLFVASLLLWWRGYFRPHWTGTFAGGLPAAIPLVPWALDVARDPAIAAAGKGFLGRGLLLLFPLVRGVLYLLRYGSLSLAGKMGRFDFTSTLGPETDRWLHPLAAALAGVLGVVTLAIPLFGAVRLWRRVRGRWRRRLAPGASGREWLRGYVVWCFAAALLVFSLSPTTIMSWQGLILFHAAAIPPVLALGALARLPRWASRVRRGAWAYAGVEIALGLVMALASPHDRCGGRSEMRLALAYDSPMLHELGIQDACPQPLDQPDGWWPDVLPPAGAASTR
jgi:hypothetical protein